MHDGSLELDSLRLREAAAHSEIATANAAIALVLEQERQAISVLAVEHLAPQIEAYRLAEILKFSLDIVEQGNISK